MATPGGPQFELGDSASPTPPLHQFRNPIGWVTLTLILGSVFVSQLLAYLGRDSNPKQAEQFHSIKQQLRMMVMMESVERTFNLPNTPNPTTPRTVRMAMEEDVALLRKKIAESDEARKLLAEIEYETGRNVDQAALNPLAKSTNAEDKAYALIYSSPKLTADQFSSVQAGIRPKDFSRRLALAHAKQKAAVPNPRAGLVNQGQTITLLVALFGVATALVIGVIAFVLLVINSLKPLPGHPVGNLTPPEADAFAIRASQSLILFILSGIIVAVAARFLFKDLHWLSTLVVSLLSIAFTWALYARPIRPRVARTGLQEVGVRQPTLRLIGWGILGALANAPIVAMLAVLGDWAFKFLPKAEHPIEQVLTNSPSALTILSLFVAASVQAPFFEEITFRGTIFPALSTVLKSPLWGGVVSSLLFAMIHPTGIPAWPALAAIGGMSAFLSYRTNSLVPSITMHCVHNAATLAFALMIG